MSRSILILAVLLALFGSGCSHQPRPAVVSDEVRVRLVHRDDPFTRILYPCIEGSGCPETNDHDVTADRLVDFPVAYRARRSEQFILMTTPSERNVLLP